MFLVSHTEVFLLARLAYSVVMVKPSSSIYVSDVSNSKIRQFVGR